MDFLRHLFIPHHSNNFRARILHHGYLSFLVLTVLLFSIITFVLKSTNPQILGISYSINEQELLQFTNIQRIENGTVALSLNHNLSQAARKKAEHMFSNNYWAHFAPDGTTPWVFIKDTGYEYSYAGENLAKGFSSSEEVVKAWMNSKSHRENLLSTKYSEIGFAVLEGTLEGEETVLIVQMFASPTGFIISNNSALHKNLPDKNYSRVDQKVSGEQNTAKTKPMINSYTFTKSLSISFLIFVVTVLVLDLIVVERKKIPRIVGHNLDHIILLILFLILIFIETNKGIL